MPGLSGAGAGALVFSRGRPDIAWGMNRCLRELGGLLKTAVWDSQGALCQPDDPAADGFAAFPGQLALRRHRRGLHTCSCQA